MFLLFLKSLLRIKVQVNQKAKASKDEVIKWMKERDELKTKLEATKMRVIDLEIELNESSLILSEVLKISEGRELNKIKKSKSFFELQKSGKVVARLDKQNRITRSYNDLNIIEREEQSSQPNVNKLSRKIAELSKEIEIKNSKIIEQQRCISILEDALRENNNIAEFEQLLAVVRSKDERINALELILNNKGSTTSDYKEKRILELEEALKESFMIAAEREKVFYEEEQRRIETLHKMGKMEQRVRSLQNASAMACLTCSPLMRKLKSLETSLDYSRRQQDVQLREIARVVQDILEEVISEKDSQIAELEMQGVLDESETKRCDALHHERDRLLDRLKIENERILSLQRARYQEPRDAQAGSLTVDLTLADDLLATDTDNEEDIPATVL